MNSAQAKRILETALICAQQPLTLRDMRTLFEDALGVDTLRQLLHELAQEWEQKGVELVCVSSGWRFQSRPEMRRFWIACIPKNRRATRVPRWKRWPSLPTASRSRAATSRTFVASRSIRS